MHVASFSSQKAQWGKIYIKTTKTKTNWTLPLFPGSSGTWTATKASENLKKSMQVVASGPVFLPCWHMFGVLKTMIQHDVVTDWYYTPFDVM